MSKLLLNTIMKISGWQEFEAFETRRRGAPAMQIAGGVHGGDPIAYN